MRSRRYGARRGLRRRAIRRRGRTSRVRSRRGRGSRSRVGRASSTTIVGTFTAHNARVIQAIAGDSQWNRAAYVSDYELPSWTIYSGSGGSADTKSISYLIVPRVTDQLTRALTGDVGYSTYRGIYDLVRIVKYTVILRPPAGLRTVFTEPASQTPWNYPELAGLPTSEPVLTYIDIDASQAIGSTVGDDGDLTTDSSNRYARKMHRFDRPIVRTLYPRYIQNVYAADAIGASVSDPTTYTVPIVRRGAPWLAINASQYYMGGIVVCFPYRGSKNVAPYNQPQVAYGIESKFTVMFKMPLFG